MLVDRNEEICGQHYKKTRNCNVSHLKVFDNHSDSLYIVNKEIKVFETGKA